MDENDELTAKEAAEILETSRSTISKYCRDGVFPNAYQALDTYDKPYWLIPRKDLAGVEIKMGRPKKNK